MHVTEFLGRHLAIQETTPLDVPHASCKMCGERITEGIAQRKVIKPSFTDYEYLRCASRWVCKWCAACLGVQEDGTKKTSALKTHSFFCTEQSLIILKQPDLWGYLINPKPTPFVFGLTFGSQKHIAFKCRINTESDYWTLTTDSGDTILYTPEVGRLTPIIQQWFSATLKGQQHTWFTRSNILTGDVPSYKIEAYGRDKFHAENAVLDPYRGGLLLKVLVHAVNKKEVGTPQE